MAKWSSVSPYLSLVNKIFGSFLFSVTKSRSNCTTFAWPFLDAKWSDVLPSSPLANKVFGSMLFSVAKFRSDCTTFSCPLIDAKWIGVLRESLLGLTCSINAWLLSVYLSLCNNLQFGCYGKQTKCFCSLWAIVMVNPCQYLNWLSTAAELGRSSRWKLFLDLDRRPERPLPLDLDRRPIFRFLLALGLEDI